MMAQEATRRLLQAGSASVLVKLANVGLGFAVAVVLARYLGAEGYGQYAFVYAIVSIVQIPTQMGLPILIVRETARADQEGRTGLMRALWRWAHLVVLGMALAVLILTFLVIHFFGSGIATPEAFFWGLALIPMIALAGIRGAALRGVGHVILGQLPEAVLRPLFLLGLLGAAILLFGQELAPETALILHVVAATVAFCIGAYFLFRHTPQASAAESIAGKRRVWLVAACILGATGSLQVINGNFDLVMLGLLKSEGEVGIYKIAATAAGFVAFGLQALNMVIMPSFSRLYQSRDMLALQELVTSSARAIAVSSLATAIPLIWFGRELISFAFGSQFERAYIPLIILVSGHLLGASLGSLGPLLNMTGHERVILRLTVLAFLLNILLNIILIPPYGSIGAAAATAASLLTLKFALAYQAEKILGINVGIIGARATPR